MFEEYNGYAVGFKTAFVAQDGYFGMPASADTLFIGGTDRFKDSEAAKEACRLALGIGKRVHVGRVNGAARFYSWYKTGATTCDGSGVSRYDHMILRIRELIEKELHNEQT
jgi:hypothetical protein